MGTTTDALPNFETETRPVVPATTLAPLSGLYDDWQPVPTTVSSPVAAALETQAPTPVASTKSSAKATTVMALCAAAIVAIVVVSAIRMSGFAGVEMPADELSGRYLRELVLWVPMVAALGFGLAAAGVMRTRASQ